MASGDPSAADPTANGPVTLSTGHTVALPVRLRATMLGATFAAPADALVDLLPGGLDPVRATPTGDAAITLLSVEYHDVDVPGLAPYDEFAVIVPASHTATTSVPYVSALTRATNGYVWYMPVTTEASKAFGREIWGFPKVVADITHEDRGSVRTTTVTVDGERFVTLEVDRPPSVDTRDEGVSYTVTDGRVCSVPSTIDAEVGLWPFSTSVSVSFGDHPKAAPLRALDLGPRALGRISLDGDVSFDEGAPVADDGDHPD